MNKAILDSVKLLHIVDDDTACFGHEVLHESIRVCGDADADETFGTKDTSVMFPLSVAIVRLADDQDLERHAHLGFDVPIVRISKPRVCGYFPSLRPHKWRVVRLNTSISEGSALLSPHFALREVNLSISVTDFEVS